MNSQLILSDAYRSSRSKTSIFCAVGLAWSAAQFEFEKVLLAGLGELDLSRASIALLISLCILYSFTRCTTEYAMQVKNVRRWRLARFDYKLSLNLVRGSVLMLAASGLNRSVSTAAYIAVCIVLFLVSSMFLEMIGTLALTPLLIFIRKRQGRYGVASRVAEASAWSRLVILVLAIIVLICIGFASLYYPPLHNLWPTPPIPITIWVVTATAIVVLISFVLQDGYLDKLFALVEEDRTSGVTTVYDGNGEVQISYKKR